MIQKFSLYSALTLCLTAFFSHPALASDLATEENNTIVKEDIASAQVTSEVCPTLLGQNAKFDSTIQRLIQTYLEEYSEQGMTYAQLQADSEYQSILAETRQGAKQTSQDEQKAACEEVLSYQE